jgi:hypothetical protein
MPVKVSSGLVVDFCFDGIASLELASTRHARSRVPGIPGGPTATAEMRVRRRKAGQFGLPGCSWIRSPNRGFRRFRPDPRPLTHVRQSEPSLALSGCVKDPEASALRLIASYDLDWRPSPLPNADFRFAAELDLPARAVDGYASAIRARSAP